MPAPIPRITVNHLTMAYGSFVIQRDLTFTIQPGEICIIMGGSGCGKSTLLRHLIGLLRPAQGEVFYDGESFWAARQYSPTRFYVLPTLTDASPPIATGKRELTIGIGPVTLPPYLDRPQIVTRASRAKLTLGEYDQWAAALQDSVARVLAENLSLLIPTDRVVLHPWPRQTAVDYQVTVEVTQFDRTMAGEVVLAARWSIATADGPELLLRKARLSAPAGGQEYEATVTAMSRTLEALSRDIAVTIQTIAQPAPAC